MLFYFAAVAKTLKMETYDEIKKILKGLVVSTQKEMTVGQLAHEYNAQTGTELCYSKYHFSTMTEMIRSMRDTFVVLKVVKYSRYQISG